MEHESRGVERLLQSRTFSSNAIGEGIQGKNFGKKENDAVKIQKKKGEDNEKIMRSNRVVEGVKER